MQMYLDIEGRSIEAPKTRSLAAIRRSHMTALHSRTPNTLDDFKMRAFQYVCWRYEIRETQYRESFRENKRSDWRERGVGFDILPVSVHGKSQARIRAVIIDGETYAIPNWDFVAAEIDEGVFQ